MAEKLNLSSLKAKAEAESFVSAANAPMPAEAKSDSGAAGDVRLIVEGYLKNRRDTCRPAIQFFLSNSSADWIDQHAIAGRGGAQIVLNYLIQRGIEAVERDFSEKGPVISRGES